MDQGYEVTKSYIGWETFIEDVISRFGPGKYNDALGQLTKLKPKSTWSNSSPS